MGTSGTMNTSNQYVKYNITINQNWQSISENKSNVTVNVYFWRTNSGYTTYGSGTCYCKINGVTYSASVSPSQKITNSGITLFSKTLDIYHNSDGSKQLDCSAWISLNTPLSSSEQWYSQWLSTIPRSSNITLSSEYLTMGDDVTIYTNRAVDYFKHKLYYQIGDSGWQYIAENIDNSYTWNISQNFANNSPNSDNLDIRLWLETYDNGNYLGVSSALVHAHVPDNFVPQITDITLNEAVEGLHDLFGSYIQSKSKISGQISATGSHGSTIKNYTTNINNQNFFETSFTTNEIIGSGTLNAVVTVTDSRGRSVSRTVQYTVMQYDVPTIAIFKGVRANSSGIEDDKGDCVLLDITATITPLNDINTKTFLVKYKKTTESAYNTVNITPESYSYNGTYLLQNIDTDYEYDIMLQVDDYFSSSVKNINIPTGFTLMDFNASGRGMAIGRVSSSDSLQVAMDINAEHDIIQPQYLNGRRIKYIPNQTSSQYGWYKVLTGKFDRINDNHSFCLSVLLPHCSIESQQGYGRLYVDIRNENNDIRIVNFYAEFLGGMQSNFFKLDVNADEKEYYLYAKTSQDWDIFFFEVVSECSLDSKSLHPIFQFESPNSDDVLGDEPAGIMPTTAKEKVLYDNISGSNGTITLSENISNFDFVQIFYKNNDNIYRSEIIQTNVNRVALDSCNVWDWVIYLKASDITISGDTITWGDALQAEFSDNSTRVYGFRYLYITKVIAW